jgi:hypothetical protein
MILIQYLHMYAISYEQFRIDSLVYFMCVVVVSLLGYGEKRYCVHCPLNPTIVLILTASKLIKKNRRCYLDSC